jgi:NADP-dependent aldehyde dehydrogenase
MITGEALIGGVAVRGEGTAQRAFNPGLEQQFGEEFNAVSVEQVNEACRLAGAAFDTFRATSDNARADLLDAIARNILDLGAELVERAMAETGLPQARLEGERARTCNQLKMFANLLREGSWCDPRIDVALPTRTPPRADLRYRLIGVGPVAVFGASNFPLAFSVAGGDTASALAAGCPVVVKAHSAHPGTSELVARAVVTAVAQCGLPAGVFALLTGSGSHIGQTLVAHPAIQAVGFTGSRSGGGRHQRGAAAARKQPIPVYAEMSSINPVFLLPEALAGRPDSIAAGFAASLTLGVGQFCTNPGLVLGIEGPGLERFCASAAQALGGVAPATMLSAGIAGAYQRGVQALAGHEAVQTVVATPNTGCKGGPALFRTSAQDFLAQHALSDEVFGPASLVIACRDLDEMISVAEHLEGQLTATLQMADGDAEAARKLLPVLERKAGRILANGYPTGVEVTSAMVHGGPYPSTSDGRSTSVGTAAIYRFLRAVCYQDLPATLLPPVLQDANPGNTWRRRDGVLGQH